MKELIIDTSTNLLYVGLLDDAKEIVKTRIGKNDNAAYLVETIKEVLEEGKLTLANIDNIIVGKGPGSYTGVRVAVVVAKTLAYTKNIPLKIISSLNLLSSGYKNQVTAAIDARRGYYFVGTYNCGKEIISDQYQLSSEINNELVVLNEKTINVSLKTVSKAAKTVQDIHQLEPNYLRRTEAENSYDQKNDFK